jgi:ABC-type phosphate/phosphonate transport system substrate-binding protein
MAVAENEKPKPVRIGVYIRTGFEPCLDNWEPTAASLTQANPGYQFTILPLATREDVYEHLEHKRVDFLIVNPVVYLCTEQRFGTSVLCGMTNRDTGPTYTGSLIRKADRDDLATIKNLRSTRFSAVKPWSFSGWIMQWNVLDSQKINPVNDLTQVQFEGTHLDVIQSVLDGVADTGAVGTDILKQQITAGKLDPDSLFVFDREGKAVPLTSDVLATTEAYPSLVFAKAATASDELAQSVSRTLLETSSDPSSSTSTSATWTIPQNYQKVRDRLDDLIGPNYAFATEMIPKRHTTMTIPIEVIVIVAIALILGVILLIAWQRARKREDSTEERLRIIRSELQEVRASKNLIETILTHVQCGMDVVNEANEIIYATPGLEHRYGPWHGKKCHEYYWDSTNPCAHCKKRLASEHRQSKEPYAGSCHVTLQEDHHPIGGGPPSKDAKQKLLQVPFYDENGQWLYARVHLPPDIAQETTDTEMVLVQLQQD